MAGYLGICSYPGLQLLCQPSSHQVALSVLNSKTKIKIQQVSFAKLALFAKLQKWNENESPDNDQKYLLIIMRRMFLPCYSLISRPFCPLHLLRCMFKITSHYQVCIACCALYRGAISLACSHNRRRGVSVPEPPCGYLNLWISGDAKTTPHNLEVRRPPAFPPQCNADSEVEHLTIMINAVKKRKKVQNL